MTLFELNSVGETVVKAVNVSPFLQSWATQRSDLVSWLMLASFVLFWNFHFFK